MFGEDYRELLRDVAAGVSESEYLDSSAGSFVRRQAVSRLHKAAVSLPPPPTAETIPDKDELIRTLETENAVLRKRDAEKDRIIARQEKRIAELERGMARIEKSVERLKTA